MHQVVLVLLLPAFSGQPIQVKPIHNHNYQTLLTKINPIRPLTRASIPKKETSEAIRVSTETP